MFSYTVDQFPWLDSLSEKHYIASQHLAHFIWKFKGLKIAKTPLKKKNKMGGFTLPVFKTYYKAALLEQCGDGSLVYIYVQTNQIVHFKYVPFIGYQLYLNKAIKILTAKKS